MKSSIEGVRRFLQLQPKEVLDMLVQHNRQVPAEAAEQYWGQPYDERYLVVTFPRFEFKPTDILALTRRAEIDDEGADDALDFIEARELRNRTWPTRLALSKMQPSDEVYLHFFYVVADAKGEGRVEHTTMRLFSASEQLPHFSSPETVDGMVCAPHPRIAPGEIPHLENFQAAKPAPERGLSAAQPTAALASTASALPYSKLFLSFDGLTYTQLNCYSVPGAAQSWDYLAVYDKEPSSPTDHYHNGFAYISSLTDGIYYNFATWARTLGGDWTNKKWHNQNFWTLDLDAASKLRIWYVRWENGKWTRLGEVVPFKASFDDWMRRSVGDIGAKMLHQIAIPGTHDSGCFDMYAKGVTSEFSQAQNLDFAGQLRYGVRYFDLRLYIANNGDYYFNHSSSRTHTRIQDFVAALESFLGQQGNQEIVIADFSRFGQKAGRDFTPSDYKTIFEMFTKSTVLAPLLANGAHLTKTVSEMMQANKRLVLLCDKCTDSWFVTMANGLGISVYEPINLDAEWPDTSVLDTLRTKMEQQVAKHNGYTGLWSLQAQLTPLPLLQTMFGVATTCNAVTAKWINDAWRNDVNVVMCDFVAGGGMVEVLIDCNKGRP